MPQYEFCCPDCGTFQLQLTMKEASSAAVCPACGQSAVRVYSSVSVMTMEQSLRRRMELGAQPQVKRREEITGLPLHSHQHQPITRPWQAGH